MDAIGALFLIAVGVGILAVARHGRLTGELPAGSNFLRGPWRPNREDNPVAFRAFLALYFCGGIALAAWGVLILAGLAPPLKLQ